MIALIVLIPLIMAAAAVFSLRGRNASLSKYVALAGTLAALILLPLVSYGQQSIPWFSAAGYQIAISVSVAPLNFILLAVVLAIGPLVFVYSMGYMDKLSEQRRYYTEMLAFEAAMATFAVSGNFILMFIAWEFLSLTSYLLIGFWNSRDQANRAARKAITTILIGDLAFLAAIVLFWSMFGTLQFSQILPAIATAPAARLYAAVLLLLAAVFTKSAQFPFHEWLIDAMEGPTPVSAFLHSSTMVKAGVFMVMVLYPLFSAPQISGIIMAIGAVTAIIATLAASREMHIKKVIAYSTIQELSLMLVVISTGAVAAGAYFFFVQSFYKALLFFIAGIAMKATGSEQLDKVAGLSSSRIALVSALFGALSLAGFLPFSGFFAASSMASALYGNLALYAIVSAISMLTSFYIFRWIYYLSRKTRTYPAALSYMAQPASMVYPPAILAAATLAVSVLFFYFNGFVSGGAANAQIPGALTLTMGDSVVLTALAAVGAAAAYGFYWKGSAARADSRGSMRMVHTGHAVNLAYNAASSFTVGLCEGVAVFDRFVSDGFDRFGRLTVASGYSIRRASVGNVNSYALIFAVSAAVIFVVVYFVVAA